VLCGPSLLNWSDAEYAFLFWMQGGVPGQFRMSPGMRWYSAVGLHTAQGISDKLRELTRHDHGASAVHQALHVIQNTLQGAASHRCRFEESSLVWVIPAVTHHIEHETTGSDDEITVHASAACAAEVSSLLHNTAVQRAVRCQSSRQWSAAESPLTRKRVGPKSVRVRIGQHFIERMPGHLLPLFRLDFCRHQTIARHLNDLWRQDGW